MSKKISLEELRESCRDALDELDELDLDYTEYNYYRECLEDLYNGNISGYSTPEAVIRDAKRCANRNM